MSNSLAIIAESGLYTVVFKAKPGKNQHARDFQNWVSREVLPSIRKTGSYSVTKQPTQEVLPPIAKAYQLPASYAEALRALADEAEKREVAAGAAWMQL